MKKEYRVVLYKGIVEFMSGHIKEQMKGWEPLSYHNGQVLYRR